MHTSHATRQSAPIEIDEERLAEAKQLLHTEDDTEAVAKAADIAVGAIHQRRAARQRLSELAGEGSAFGEARPARASRI